MAVSAKTRAMYQDAVNELVAAIDGYGVLVAADTDGMDESGGTAEQAPDELHDALDNYLAASTAVFDEASGDDPDVGWASLGGDLRTLQQLAELEAEPGVGTSLAAGAGSDYATDMDDVVAAVNGEQEARLALDQTANADPLTRVKKAIDDIEALGLKNLEGVISKAFVPSVDQVAYAVSAVVGPEAGKAVKELIGKLNGFFHRIARAIAKVAKAILDKITSIFGTVAHDKFEAWVKSLLDPQAIYGRIVGVDVLKREAEQVLATATDARDRADRCAAAVSGHESAQRYVGWGSTALGWASGIAKINAVQPWGPIVLGAVTIALLAAASLITVDYLDSPGFGWLPDLVPGVGAALAG